MTQWCREEGASPESNVVIELLGEDWTEEQIGSTDIVLRQTLSLDKKTWVIDVRPDREASCTHVLLEWKQGIPDRFRGSSMQLAEFHLIQSHTPDRCLASTSRVKATREEVPSMLSSVMIGPELFAAMGDFVSKLPKDTLTCSGSKYQKLRPFPGRNPVPTGEDNFEEWLDQATQALDEWNIPETLKKQRI